MSSGFDRAIQNLVQIIKESDKNKTSALDTQAEVLRIEEGTAWVHLPGGVDETPVKLTMNAQVGDIVQVRIAGGRAWLTGNATSPPTDDKVANQAMGAAASAQQEVITVKEVVAENIRATNAKFEYVEADTAKIHNLEADEIHAGITYTNELIAGNVTTEKLTAASGYIQELTAENITAQDITADHAEINDLDVNYAQIDAANINTAAIRSAWVDQMMVQSGLIAHEGTVYELDAIQVNASKIKTGTLDVERLIVSVPDPQDPTKIHKYMVHVDPSTGSPSYEKVDADVLEDLTITADKIVAGAITAEKITTENIVGSGGWINLRNGTFNYTNASTGNGISWDGQHLNIRANTITMGSSQQTLEQIIEGMQSEIDGAIETWYESQDPLPDATHPNQSNAPASSWTTAEQKNNHLRDLYFNTTNGHSYRWAQVGNAYYWVQIEDADAIKALADAAAAQETADNGLALAGVKRRVFVATPVPPYDIGDLWMQGANSDIMKCKTAKAKNASYAAADWEKASKYTDDTAVTQFSSRFSVTPENISSEVIATQDGKTLATRINQDANTVKIQASKLDITGTTVFSDGTSIQSRIDAVDVGGRNWLVGTGTSISKATTATSSYVTQILYDTPDLAMLSELGFASNDEVTLSFDWKITSATTYGNARIEWYGKTSSGENNYIAPLIHPFATFSASNTSGHVKTTVKLTSATIQAKRLVLRIDNSNLTLTISNLKFEKGNKATDWTPAPEDVQAEIDAKRSVWTINSNYVEPYRAILGWAAEGYAADINPVVGGVPDGLQVGDTCRVKMQVSDMSNASVYLIMTVTEKTSSTRLKGTSHGLDTTIIDGGNIITNSIGANQLAANAIDTSKLTVGARNDMLNSNIKVGGRNLLLGTARSDTWTSNHSSGGFTTRDCYQTYLPVNALFKVNDLVTISFDWSTNATGGNFHVECGNVTPWSWGTIIKASGTRASNSNYVDITSSNQSGHVEITYQTTSAQVSAADTFRWLRIRTDGDAIIGKTMTISNAKAEYGNQATAWTPALEDDSSGKNLMRYTHKLSLGTVNSGAATYSTGTDSTVPSGQYLRATTTTAHAGGVHISTGNLGFDYNSQMVNGTTYTFSAWVRSSMAFTFSALGPERFSPNAIKITKVPANTWTYVWCTGVFNTNTQYVSCSFYTNSTWEVGSTLDISSMKLELGSQPTPWTPAPGDMSISYMHADSNGLRIASANPASQNQRVQLTDSRISFYDSDNLERMYLSKYNVVAGRLNSGHSVFSDGGIDIYDVNNKLRTKVNNDGLNVYDTDGSTNVAHFGSTARIGAAGSQHITLTSNALQVWTGAESIASNKVASFGSTITLGRSDGTGDNAHYHLLLADQVLNFKYGTMTCGQITQHTDARLTFSVTNNSDMATINSSGVTTKGRFISSYMYNNTISTDNRVAINSSGQMGRYASSSRRYKEQIEDSTFDPHGLYELRARQFKYKDGYFALDDDNPHAYDLQVGFIAEEVDECYPQAAVYDVNTGEVESWEERKIIPPMLTLIQELNDRVTELERRAN